ncbi:MAG: MFS transporter [Promethearchaeota archaeon]
MADKIMREELLTQQQKFKPRMKPNTPGKLNYGRTILIALGFFSCQTAWAYYNFIMPLILRPFIQDLNWSWIGDDSFVGAIMVLDNLVAVLLLPYFGVISDHTKSRFGKRIPYIMIGGITGAIFFSFIPHMQTFAGLIAIIMSFNLSMAFYRSCAIALMPDLTDPSVRSTGNAVVNIIGAFALIAGLASSVVVGQFVNVSTISGQKLARTIGFHYVSIIMLIALIILFFTIRETPTGSGILTVGKHPIAVDPITFEYYGEQPLKDVKTPSKWKYLKEVFSENDKSAIFLLLAIFASAFGFNAIETFYSSFAVSYLHWTDAEASKVLVMAPISVVLASVPIGKLSDRIGRRLSFMIGLVGLSLSVETLHYMDKIFPNKNELYIANIVVVMFAGIFVASIGINGIVMVWELSPPNKIGAYTGTYYMFSQLAAILSPVVAGFEFDQYKQLFPDRIIQFGEGYQYRMLFFYVFVWQIVALILMAWVRVDKKKILSKDEIKNLRDQFGEDD